MPFFCIDLLTATNESVLHEEGKFTHSTTALVLKKKLDVCLKCFRRLNQSFFRALVYSAYRWQLHASAYAGAPSSMPSKPAGWYGPMMNCSKIPMPLRTPSEAWTTCCT